MRVARDILREYPFESRVGSAIVRREPIGVCALISPWNWPIQTGVIKIIYALAAGCTIVAKPSVNSAASGTLMAQVLHEADVPPGVFNLVNGTGRDVGDALSRHPGVDMISFTGSTAAGATVGAAAADTVKRVCLELGGKSANIVLPDADLEKAARWNIQRGLLQRRPVLPRPHPDAGAREPAGAGGALPRRRGAAASAWVTRWTARRPWALLSAQPSTSRSETSSRALSTRARTSSPVDLSALTVWTGATSCNPRCSPV